jgi:hypothetical protein
MDTEHLIELIQSYTKNSAPFPFLAHIDYFKNQKDELTVSSAASKWQALTQENYVSTWFKSVLVFFGLNDGLRRTTPGCPWKSQFDSNETVMRLLKHSRDTGILNSDGSVNIDILTQVMTKAFYFDTLTHQWWMTQSSLLDVLKESAERDKTLPDRAHWFTPTWESVAHGEWEEFFKAYTERWLVIDEETEQYQPAVSADTFLQFYLEPATLYTRIVVTHELPAPFPS